MLAYASRGVTRNKLKLNNRNVKWWRGVGLHSREELETTGFLITKEKIKV